MTRDHKDEGLLARWSRLKQDAGSNASSKSDRVLVQERTVDAAVDSLAGKEAIRSVGTTEPAGADAGEVKPDDHPLPSLDDLRPESDLVAFLDKRVPDTLRNAALRRMWSMDPAIRDFIEMAENQYDWNTPGGAPGYGELAPGTDVRALLAQATGALPRSEPKMEASNANAASAIEIGGGECARTVNSGPAEATAHGVEAAGDGDGCSPADIAVQRWTENREVSVAEPDAKALCAALPRGRHGGALPS